MTFVPPRTSGSSSSRWASRRWLVRATIATLVAVGLLPTWPASVRAAELAGHLSGTVRDSTGEAQADAEVVLVDPSGRTVATDTTGMGGRYSFTVSPATYDLGVVTKSPVERVARIRGVEVGPDTTLDVVVLPPYVTLSGTVRNASGAALGRNIKVYAGWRWVETDDNGRYSITAPAGTTSLSVSMSGAGWGEHFTARLEQFTLTTDRTLDLTVAFTTLTVKVVDQRDTPLPNAWVWTHSAEDCQSGCQAGFELFPGAGRTTATSSAGGYTDGNGVVSITTLPVDQLVRAAAPAAPGLLAATPKRMSWPWSAPVKMVQRDAPPPPAPDPADPPVTVRWTGILRHNGVPVEGSVGGHETDGDGRFEVELPPGHHSVDIYADIGNSRNCDSGGCSPATHINVPDFEITADRSLDINIPTSELAVHAVDQQGYPARALASGTSGGDDRGSVEIFPGGVGHGSLRDNADTDAAGNATLLMFPGSPPPVVSVSQNGSLRGSAPVAPTASSVTVQFSAVILSGTVRDARGPLPLVNWPWLSFTGSYGRYDDFDGADISPDGSYSLQVMPGRHTLTITDQPQFDENDTDQHVATATLPQVWTIRTDLDLTRSTTLDFTVPDAAPARFRAVGPDGQPLVSHFNMQSFHTVEAAPGISGSAVAETNAFDPLGQYEHMLFGEDREVDGWIRLAGGDWDTPSWGFSLHRLTPGDNIALALSSTYSGGDIMPVTTTTTTALPVTTTTTTTPPQRGDNPGATIATTPDPAKNGYWALSSDGKTYNFGDAPGLGDSTAGAVDLEPTPNGSGYWILNRNGNVAAFGEATKLGNVELSKLATGEQPASLSATPSGKGYWVFTNRGRAIAFGDAPHLGDMADTKLNGPVLGSVATPSGRGYYMVASDGGIFAFGDAAFAGSMGGRKLNAPVQSLVPDADGKGYWLVASDGGIFAFDAPFRGSMGGTKLNKPVVGMVRYGDGYLMVGADGGIFNFSSSTFAGSLGDKPPASPVVAVAALP